MTTIEEKIETSLIGTLFDIERVKQTLEKVVGKPAKWVDSKIDDGTDDDETEDEYIMMDSFDCGELYIRVFYGNNSFEITYVDIN